MALEQPKRPTGGAFGSFLAEKRPEFTKACEGKKASAISQLAGEAWKKLSDAEKAPYQKKYEAAKSKFDTDMAAFLQAGGQKKKGILALRAEKRKAKEDPKAKRAKKVDPNRPKRPVGGAFGCYMAKNREALQKECPGAVTGVTKLAASKWKALSDKEKEPYDQEFKKAQEAYNEAMKSYVPPDGDDAGGDEDTTGEEASPAKSSPGKRGRKTAAPTPGAAKRGRKGAAAAAPGVELEAKIVQEAEKLNLLGALRNLAARPDIVASGKSNDDLLEALKSSGGLVNPAKTALLGA